MKLKAICFATIVFSCGILLASTGGPDSFGYRWIDSDELGGPTYNWIDISGSSSPGPTGDDAHSVITLPTPFEFYGNTFTQITVCTNGWCALGSWSTSSLSTSSIPSTSTPQNVIACTYMDMRTGSGRIYSGTHTDGRFVVTWDGVEEYSASGTIYSYQVVLDFDRRSVTINYRDVDDMVSTYRTGYIGIENNSGTIGLLYGVHSDDSTVLHSSLSILFRADLVVGPPYFNDCYTSSDFETEGEVNDWELGRPLSVGPTTVHSFPYCWATKKEAFYSSYSNSILLPPRMSIAGVGQPVFDWWQWFETDSGDDGGVVEISTNDGLTWSVIEPEDGYPCPALGAGSVLAGLPAFSGSSDGWEYQSIDLSSWTSYGEVWLRFHFGADGMTEGAGWYIDDVGLQESFGVVKGHVNLDYRTNDSGAKIEVTELGLHDYSDSTGYYFIDSVKAGTWNLTCTRDSFAEQEFGPFTISRNETIDVDFLMPPILMSTNFDTNSAGGIPTPEDGWQWGIPDTLASPPYSAHSDTFCWGTNLHGNYMNNVSWTLDFVVFLVANNPHMQLHHWYKIAGEYAGYFWDGANVKITNYYDTTWTVAPAILNGYDGSVSTHNTFMGGQPCFGGTGYGDTWHQEIFDLSDYAMDTVIVRFEIGADGAGTARGWYIDDIIIVDFDTTGISENPIIWKPDCIKMGVHPNPFNAVANIEFSLPTEGRTTVEILDLTGRLVKKLSSEEYLSGGFYTRRWDGRDFAGNEVSSGIYLARVSSGRITSSKTLLLVK
ncbi:T9SS type A sorting domain-containing protein [bacterium]|nr:T9SS type A sorting domain-containing protein [bacterium]